MSGPNPESAADQLRRHAVDDGGAPGVRGAGGELRHGLQLARDRLDAVAPVEAEGAVQKVGAVNEVGDPLPLYVAQQLALLDGGEDRLVHRAVQVDDRPVAEVAEQPGIERADAL